MASDGYSNKVLIGNWFEDRVLEHHLKSQTNESMNRSTKLVHKVMMDFGHVS